MQRESSGGGSPDSPGAEVQSQPNGVTIDAGPIQTPITTALGLMHKMEGVSRLLAGEHATALSSFCRGLLVKRRPMSLSCNSNPYSTAGVSGTGPGEA